MLIIRSNGSLGEALRLCAAMLGMDETPIITFIESGVHCLLPNAVRDPSILEYLQTVSDIAGVYVLEESLREEKRAQIQDVKK